MRRWFLSYNSRRRLEPQREAVFLHQYARRRVIELSNFVSIEGCTYRESLPSFRNSEQQARTAALNNFGPRCAGETRKGRHGSASNATRGGK